MQKIYQSIGYLIGITDLLNKKRKINYLNQYKFLNTLIYREINPQEGKYFSFILQKINALNRQIFFDQYVKKVLF
nr:hypothetical protein GTC16762_12530 [Pigmentibacter ruber]